MRLVSYLNRQLITASKYKLGNKLTDGRQHTLSRTKMVQNMIMYMQDVPLFGKFFNYGCHCFTGGIRDMFATTVPQQHAKPVDQPDNMCRNHERCHQCVKFDHGARCDAHKGYRFEARQDSVTGSKYITCLNENDSCQKAHCECDKALAYDLAEYEYIWSLLNHREWSNFDPANRCIVADSTKEIKARMVVDVQLKLAQKEDDKASMECCGEYPRRYPYHPVDDKGNVRECCGSTPFDPYTKECCLDGTPRQFGECN